MKHEEGEFTGVDNLKIYYESWLPENPKAVVQVVHGLAEYVGRYQNVVDALIPRGFAIYGDDHRGHGKSEGERGYVDSFMHFIEDEKILFDIIKKKHPNLPIFMLGHSMGSLIAIKFVELYEKDLKGLILSGTGNKPGGAGASAFMRVMARLMGKIAPHKRFSADLDPKLISNDPEVVEAYDNDPQVFKEITAKLGAETLKGFGSAKKIARTFTLPCLIQAGSADNLVFGAKEFSDELTTSDKTVKIYEGLYHEVYNEIEADRKTVLKDLGDWLESHI